MRDSPGASGGVFSIADVLSPKSESESASISTGSRSSGGTNGSGPVLGDIPGVPTVMGLLILVTAVQK